MISMSPSGMIKPQQEDTSDENAINSNMISKKPYKKAYKQSKLPKLKQDSL